MYVSARGQVEPGPGGDVSASNRQWNDSEERPAKRQKKNKNLAMAEAPDAHEKAPESIKSLYKRWQRMDKARMNAAIEVLDCSGDPESKSFPKHALKEVSDMIPSDMQRSLEEFMGAVIQDVPRPRAFEIKTMPGKQMIASRMYRLSE
jgi:hypothetical protein